MRVFLHELTDQETLLDFTQEESWVSESVRRVDEHPDHLPSKPVKNRPIEAHFSLRKVDEVVVMNGNIDTHVELVCSRCATPFQFKMSPHFSALFCKDPVMAGVGHLQEKGRNSGKPAGQIHGVARQSGLGNPDADENSIGDQDLDITYLSNEFIELGDVVTEQLQLQIPFQPLCKEDCKGMCANCGADLNAGQCACAKLAKANPFAVLKDVKLGS